MKYKLFTLKKLLNPPAPRMTSCLLLNRHFLWSQSRPALRS